MSSLFLWMVETSTLRGPLNSIALIFFNIFLITFHQWFFQASNKIFTDRFFSLLLIATHIILLVLLNRLSLFVCFFQHYFHFLFFFLFLGIVILLLEWSHQWRIWLLRLFIAGLVATSRQFWWVILWIWT